VSSSVQPLVLVSGSELRSMTTLDSKSFLDFCILMGTDASPRIPGIGPARAYKAIMQYGSIESIIAQDKYRDRIDDIDAFMVMVNNAREVFGKAPPIPEGISLEQGEYNAEEVERWLRDTHGVMFMSQEQVNEGVELEKEQEWEVDKTEGSVKVEEWDETWDQAVVGESTDPEVSTPR
jgi:flap endonuclease-1